MALLVDITKKLDGFNLEASFRAEKETLAILGASGCGKSLTLRTIAGIQTPDSGHIELAGKVFFDSAAKINLPPQMRRVGYLFQDYALFPNMTVAENIASGLRDGREGKNLVAAGLKNFYLEKLAHKYPWQLSGGEKQRTALARIIVSEPALIMLDEPFSALDSYLKWQLEQELGDALTAYGGITLLVSHDRDEVFRLCDRIALINNGKMEKVTEKHLLFQSPRTLAGAMLTGCKNLSRARRLSSRQVEAIDWDIVLTTAKDVDEDIRHVGMRAHYLEARLSPEGENVLSCRLRKVVEAPFSYLVITKNSRAPRGKDTPPILWETEKAAWMDFSARVRGDTFGLYFDPAELLLLQ